mmetsp:Transcript_66990/g.139878  ORF Transcript_66990/g.139878 Transcript_66990/m.139878 type:complete len:226 (-) Transcript_66990:94-771(-)
MSNLRLVPSDLQEALHPMYSILVVAIPLYHDRENVLVGTAISAWIEPASTLRITEHYSKFVHRVQARHSLDIDRKVALHLPVYKFQSSSISIKVPPFHRRVTLEFVSHRDLAASTTAPPNDNAFFAVFDLWGVDGDVIRLETYDTCIIVVDNGDLRLCGARDNGGLAAFRILHFGVDQQNREIFAALVCFVINDLHFDEGLRLVRWHIHPPDSNLVILAGLGSPV